MDTLMHEDTVKKEEKELVFNTAEEAISYMENSGHWSEYQTGIIPQIARENIKYATSLLNNKKKNFLIVDKGLLKVIVYNKYGNELTSFRCAGPRNYGSKHGRSDCRTPEGCFSAEGIYDSRDWLYTNDAGYTSPAKGVYGPRFIRIKNPVTSSVGIHGTSSPGSIGRRVSHGCIRLKNDDIMELVKYAEVGMPIIVNPGSRDQQVNKSEGRSIYRVDVGEKEPQSIEKTSAKTNDKKAKEASKTQKKAYAKDTIEGTKKTEGTDVKETPAKTETSTTTPAKEEKKSEPEKTTAPEKTAE